MKRTLLALAAMSGVAAHAQFMGINSTFLIPRYYNDVPNSDLTIQNPWPMVHIHDVLAAKGGGNGFANRHDWAVSSDNGASALMFDGTRSFSLDFDLTLTDQGLPGVEGGVMIDNPGNGNHYFIVKTGNNGEVAAFGGGLPFYSFTAQQNVHWTLGTPVHLGIDYVYNGTSAQVQYRYNNLTSGFLNWGNIEGKLLPGSRVGGYALFQNDPNSETDFGDAVFNNVTVVPEPASLLTLGGLALLGLKRRRL